MVSTKTMLLLVGVLALSLTALGQQPVAPLGLLQTQIYGNVAVLKPLLFDADGCVLINGWYWLRPDCRQYADWLFSATDVAGVHPDDPYVYVNLGTLVTNGVSGGSGWDTHVSLEVWLVKSPEDVLGLKEPIGRKILGRSSVTLENHFRPQMEADTQGVGYQAWADMTRIPAGDIAKYTLTYGPLLVVRVIRLGAAENQPEHIAVNQDCVSLAYRIAR